MQLREALCMSSRRSSSSPSSSQLWAEATSSFNGVCSRDSTFQLLPYARYRRFRRSPDKVRLSAARVDPVEVREAYPSSISKPQRQSTVAPFMQPALSASSAVRPATGFDQDDAAGLAAERAFDCHLLEKRMLLEAAASECTLQMQPSARPVYPRAGRPRSTCSSGQACHPHACCACKRPLRATPAVLVEPLSSECPTSSAPQCGGCCAAAQLCLCDAAFKLTAASSIHIDSDPGRPEVGR